LGSVGRVENCLVYNLSDKGVSVGEGCRNVVVKGSVFYNCGAGVAVKDSSVAEIINNTIVGCTYGIECVEKNAGLGGGHATGHNNILWSNGSPVYLNSDATISLSYSDINFFVPFPGIGNINSIPLFVDSIAHNYNLMPGSPAIGSGINGSDMEPFIRWVELQKRLLTSTSEFPKVKKSRKEIPSFPLVGSQGQALHR
jgi:parallel beta-helix repeat protein